MVRLTSLVVLAPLAVAAEEPAANEGHATAETQAAQYFHKLGGKLIRDLAAPGRPVVGVELFRSRVTDADRSGARWPSSPA